MRWASRLGFLLVFAASAVAGLILVWPSADDPNPGDRYTHAETEEQVEIDQVGSAVELRIHYDIRGIRIGGEEVSAQQHQADQLFGSVTHMPSVELDPTRRYVSSLEIESSNDGIEVDTVAHLHAQDEFLEKHIRIES